MATLEQLQELLNTVRNEAAKERAELTQKLAAQEPQLSSVITELRAAATSSNQKIVNLDRESQDTRSRDKSLESRDLKALGKPDIFHGESEKWKDWSVTFRSYAATQEPPLRDWMKHAELTDVSVLNTAIPAPAGQSSNVLHYMLLMLCRGSALLKAINAGGSEGLQAWRALVRNYEPKIQGRHAGLLSGVLSFAFTDTIEKDLEPFERAVLTYEKSSKKTVPDDVKIGVVMNRMVESPLKTHLFLQGDRLEQWSDFKDEIVNTRTSQNAASAASQPMALGFMGGNNGKAKNPNIVCHNCNKKGHIKSQCRAPGGGAATKKGKDGGGKGDGRKGKGGKDGGGKGGDGGARKGKDIKCFRCGKMGHVAKDCRVVLGALSPDGGVQTNQNGQVAQNSPPQQQQHQQQGNGNAQSDPNAGQLGGLLGGLDCECVPYQKLEQESERLENYLCSLEHEVDKLMTLGGFPAVLSQLKLGGSVQNLQVRFGIDTCAASTVVPEHIGQDHPLTAGSGMNFKSVSGQALMNK